MAFKTLDIILGPPGSGKDTQAKLLAERLGYAILPLGELLRDYAQTNTELAQQMQKGELASNEVVHKIVTSKLQQYSSTDKVVSDGFPRSLAQAQWLVQFMKENGSPINSVVWLNLDREEVSNRLQKRGRADDDKAKVDHRYDIYVDQTIPVVEYFEDHVPVHKVDGLGTVEEVYERIAKALQSS